MEALKGPLVLARIARVFMPEAEHRLLMYSIMDRIFQEPNAIIPFCRVSDSLMSRPFARINPKHTQGRDAC